MAKRSSTAKRNPSRKGANADLRASILDAVFSIAADGGWRNASLSDVADRANLSIAEVCSVAPTKASLIGLLINEVDRQVLSGGPVEADEAIRHRLFDMLMRRFDALNRNRDGVLALLREGRKDPVAVLCTAPRLMRSMAMTLGAAGVSTSGLRGLARVNGLAAVYGYAVRAWLNDDSPDMAATMAALDKALATAGVIATRFASALGDRQQSGPPTDTNGSSG